MLSRFERGEKKTNVRVFELAWQWLGDVIERRP
jgi:hypothetical protein